MNKIESNKCSFCDLYPESITHLFFSCLNVRSVLCTLQAKLSVYLNNSMHISCKDIVIGYKLSHFNIASVKLVNIVLLNVKLYIWKSRCKNVTLSYTKLKQWMVNRKIFTDVLDDFIEIM